MLHKTAAPPAPTPLTLAVAPVLPVDEALRRLDSTEAGLTSDGADARRARFGPNVLTSHRVTALGVLTRQLRNLVFPPGHRGGPPPERSYRQGAGYASD
jgi:Cation transporter/ATPase, N-terminus